MLVLSTLGAPERRRLRSRRGRPLLTADPEPVPTARATVVHPDSFATTPDAERWLDALQADGEQAQDELRTAARVVNRALHAQRVATGDHAVRDVAPARALVVRIGFGGGESVADGRYARAFELPHAEPRRSARSMEAPEEYFAAVLGGRERALLCEELVLRARSDLEAGRNREAALEARVALEALRAEVPEADPTLDDRRADLGATANAALKGALTDAQSATLESVLTRMEAILRRRRLKRKG